MTDEKKPDAPAAPAVHTDELWGGPRLIENATADPVPVATKAEYFKLLNSRGLRMKDQQESTTGPQVDPAVLKALEAPVKPSRAVPPMTQDEAHVHGAITAVWKRYGLLETLWCPTCFAHGEHHGVSLVVGSKGVAIRCRCGEATYVAPVGTTDLMLSRLANTTVVEVDRSRGGILTPNGVVAVPVIELQAIEAVLIARWASYLKARQKEPRLFHKDCFVGNPSDEEAGIGLHISADRVILVCPCRHLYRQARRVTRYEATVH